MRLATVTAYAAANEETKLEGKRENFHEMAAVCATLRPQGVRVRGRRRKNKGGVNEMDKARALGVVLIGLLLLPSQSVIAQSAAGRILGRVIDEQGAALPHAKVTVTNTATQLAHATETDDEGTYQVLDLPIGRYTVSAAHDGFQTTVTEAYPLQINQNLRVDLHLPVGGRAEAIEVKGDTAGVETVSSTVGGVRNQPTGSQSSLERTYDARLGLTATRRDGDQHV